MHRSHTMVGVIVAATMLVSCGGDDTADTSGADATTDVDEPAPADAADAAASDDADPEPTDSGGDPGVDDADDADADDAGGGDDDGGPTVDVSGIDWATVDLSTIDWENIDMNDVDLVAVEDNPTVDRISDADLAVIQERLAAQFGSGAATLTIADSTWEFEGFQCAFESSGVLNDDRTLGTNLFGEIDGARIQMQIDVYDDGAAQFTLDDIDDFENPSVSYLETTDITVTVDGDSVRAEGDVTDQASESFDVVPMTFEGECGPGSLR